MTKLSYWLGLLTVCLSAFIAGNVWAHPHSWILVQSAFHFDSENSVERISQTWEFDTFYSTMTLADVMKEHGSESLGLKILGAQMIDNLESFHYFSKLLIADTDVPLGRPQSYELKTIEKDNKVLLELQLSFDISLDSRGKALHWHVYDPTYYVAMEHKQVNNIELIGRNVQTCYKNLDIPSPSIEMIEYAQSLDREQRNSDGLGIHFAEIVTVQCG